MSYIEYDKKKKKFAATGKRPNNQNAKPVLRKIASRYLRYVEEHMDLQLTTLQEKFIKHLEKQKSKYKLSDDDINIAHRIAISELIDFMVRILNDPDQLDLSKTKIFADAILSTESSSDDKGREYTNNFFIEVSKFDGKKETAKELCEWANKILKNFNACSRNYGIGYSKPNNVIKKAEDIPVVEKKGDHCTVKRLDFSENVAEAFKKLSLYTADYGPKIVGTSKGKVKVLSSSIDSDSDESYFVTSAVKPKK